MIRNKCIIGIDPDVDKSGVAYLKMPEKILRITSMEFPKLLDYLKSLKAINKNLVVVVEASWLVAKSNFHGKQGHRAERIAKNVGSNHEVGRLIVQMCQHYGIEVIEQRPLRKCWKGKEGKITHKELISFARVDGRTNQEGRDATLLAWNYANLPIIINN